MTTSAKILADSVSEQGHRFTTFEVTFPRIILAEVNTHKMLSKNSASSRAIPIKRMLELAREHPYIPSRWPINGKGMSTQEYETNPVLIEMKRIEWLTARDAAAHQAEVLLELNVHKQITNRLLEPFLFHTAVISGTDWPNFQHLRNHPEAHPDFQELAQWMGEVMNASRPKLLTNKQWHRPYLAAGDIDTDGAPVGDSYFNKVSAGLCAAVSYLRQEEATGGNCGSAAARTDLMIKSGHMSPLEHVARPMNDWEYDTARMYDFVNTSGEVYRSRSMLNDVQEDGRLLRETHYWGNLDGWVSMRKLIPYEWDPLGHR